MLTARQQQVLDFLRLEIRTSGIVPSTREIQEHFGFASQTAALNHLRALERKGAIRRAAGKARALSFPGGPEDAGVVHVPLYGDIAAGMSAPAEERVEGEVVVDPAMAGLTRGARTFALRVHGDSMIGAHIVHGDVAVFEQRPPRDGDIVAALIDGETTLKRLVQREGCTFLRAENPEYPDLIPVGELVIQGVLVSLLRRCGAGEAVPVRKGE